MKRWLRNPRRRVVVMAATAAIFGLAPGAQAQTDADALARQAIAALQAGEFSIAKTRLEAALKVDPANYVLLYNLAVAEAQLGETAQAEKRLVEAIGAGFVDFFQLERDPDLTPIRQGEIFQGVLAGWPRLLDARIDAEVDALRRRYGGRYLYDRDADLRLAYVSAFDPKTFEAVKVELRAIAHWTRRTLFPDLPLTAGVERPDPWTLVLLPTPEDFIRLVPAADIGGWYDHDARRLIAQDLGPSLRHEFLHVLHWREMTRTGQRHPEWIMEGLGALVEDVNIDSAGGVVPVPSARTNIAKRLAKVNRLPSIAHLASMERRRFVSNRPLANYAEARAVMLFLFERGALADWWARYEQTYSKDPSGLTALEQTLGMPTASIDKALRAWLLDLPEVAEEIKAGMASLGVELSLGRGDGPRVAKYLPGGRARDAGLRLGDVIVAIDGASTRTIDDAHRLLGERQAGEEVEVRLRRGRLWLTLRVPLVAARPAP